MKESDTIVAEISKTWTYNEQDDDILALRFQQVIAVNEVRGYVLHDWRFSQVVVPMSSEMVETIIAIFKKVQP